MLTPLVCSEQLGIKTDQGPAVEDLTVKRGTKSTNTKTPWQERKRGARSGPPGRRTEKAAPRSHVSRSLVSEPVGGAGTAWTQQGLAQTEANDKAQQAGRKQDKTRLARWTGPHGQWGVCIPAREPWEAPGAEGRGPRATVPFLLTTLLQVGRGSKRASGLAPPRGHGGSDEARTVQQREEHTLQI